MLWKHKETETTQKANKTSAIKYWTTYKNLRKRFSFLQIRSNDANLRRAYATKFKNKFKGMELSVIREWSKLDSNIGFVWKAVTDLCAKQIRSTIVFMCSFHLFMCSFHLVMRSFHLVMCSFHSVMYSFHYSLFSCALFMCSFYVLF